MKKLALGFLVVFGFIGTSKTFASNPKDNGQQCIYLKKKNVSKSFRPDYKSADDQIKFLFADWTPNEIYTQKLFGRLTGSVVPKTSPRFKKALSLVNAAKYFEAAKVVAQEDNFLEVRVRNFAAPFSSKDSSPLEPLNDLQALIIGVVRDEIDARQIVSGNIRYAGAAALGLPPVSRSNNDHYAAFESAGRSLAYDLDLVEDQWPDLDLGAGLYTTRQWAKINYDAGTNRRSVKNSFEQFLCTPIDSWKTRGLPDDFIRRDVDRAPGGNPSTFQNFCRNCHAPMDGFAGAFAKVDFMSDSFSFTPNAIVAKMNQNGETYPAGFVTTDDSWVNMLKYGSAADFGWRGPIEGQGIKAFSEMVANSSAYSRCMVKKTFDEVCGGSIVEAAPGLLDKMTTDFESNGYNLKYLFEKLAASSECLAYPKGTL